MPRGTSLSQLIDMLRAEARQAQDPALGQNYRATLAQVLQRTQQNLRDAFPWEFLRVRRYKALSAGQRFYALSPDMPVEDIEKAEVRIGSRWLELEYGIKPDDMLVYDSDTDSRADPAIKWQFIDEQVEVWPIPKSNGTLTLQSDGVTPVAGTGVSSDGVLRWTGIRTLKPLIADSDTADLDDDLIVLFSAAEILSSRGQKDGEAKARSAQTRFEKLTGKNIKSARRPIVVGGGVSVIPGHRRVIIPVWKP